MSFDPTGYLLTPADGPHLWFLDTRMTVKAGADQTGGAFTLIEWSAPAGFGPPRHIHDREDEAFYILEESSPSTAATTAGPPAPATSPSCPAAYPTPSSSPKGPYAACRSPHRQDSSSSSPNSAARPSTPASPHPPRPTSPA